LLEEFHRAKYYATDARPMLRAGERLRKLNDALIAAERALTDPRGLRGRAWYRHQIYAPGFYTGYAAQPLPDLRQAIDDRNTTNAREAAQRIGEAIRRATQALKAGRED
jgi:N-acetylated-alpha-linked acidic dipeptidase